MKTWTRREMMAASALGAATLAARQGQAANRPDDQEKPATPAPANESIVLGFIGVGGMGSGLLNIFKGFPQVRVAAVCDVY
ncbi:MAG: gfo/Idh/MocA family oxidoreductase, partial [Isosphaeraceae bacterium]